MRVRRRSDVRGEQGASAVEFALVVLPLVLILLGIIEFGYIFNQQLTVTNAAREGSRVLAITRDTGDAVSAATNAASTLVGTPVITTPTVCPETGPGDATVVITLALDTITGLETWVPGLETISLTGRGVTPCGG
ncbi:TadE/TadG family type IV pilus assembly protein [Agromyces bracchium]|uniref:Pilus assembly protein n=1 Tax=Agromyces bracchium TaxID=88376 RepID=A0A6I3MBH3_9MICO|nr:TadE family protein [Agromyces bracchium]MTH70371.1 pilus assembly protein [Agromyces bracchium]